MGDCVMMASIFVVVTIACSFAFYFLGRSHSEETSYQRGFDDGFAVKYPDLSRPCGDRLNPHQFGKWREWGSVGWDLIMVKNCTRCGDICKKTETLKYH
jgi:hypothetical protein